MASLTELHRAWSRVAENRIRSSQEEGEFDNLPGFGRPLEEIMDINDPHGWIRRTVRDASKSPTRVFPNELLGEADR